jgi:5-methylthioadenosine/S-adenosylhomocysteine deaminase
MILALTALSGLLRSALAAAPRTLIRNVALVLTMDPALGAGELGVREHVDILLDGDRIGQIGPGLKAAGARVVDATGKIVLPGFVDTHNHLWQSLIRGCGAGHDLNGWQAACVSPMSRFDFQPDDVYRGVRLSTVDLIGTGVTTVVDWSHAPTPRFAEENVRALTDSGLRFVFAYRGSVDPAVIAHMKHVKRTSIDPNPRATFQVGSHPAIAPPVLAGLTAMSDLAKELRVKLHVHLLENVAQTSEQVLEALTRAGALGPGLLGAHGIHLTDAEIQLLARHDARVIHNPLSNMRLASGIIRLPELKQAGVQVGLGLDGGANDASDMFGNMRAAVGLQRAKHLSATTVPTVSDVLRMATIDGAKLLDLDRRIGSLTPGKQADLIVLDPGTVNFAPRVDWISQIVFNGQPANVEWVFVDGRALKARGRLVGVQPATVTRAAQDPATRIRRFLFP